MAACFVSIAKDQNLIFVLNMAKVNLDQALQIWYISTIRSKKWEYLIEKNL